MPTAEVNVGHDPHPFASADEERRRIYSIMVKWKCWHCGGYAGPIRLDGRLWVCLCGAPLFASAEERQQIRDAEAQGKAVADGVLPG
jgi:hypothetical protein